MRLVRKRTNPLLTKKKMPTKLIRPAVAGRGPRPPAAPELLSVRIIHSLGHRQSPTPHGVLSAHEEDPANYS